MKIGIFGGTFNPIHYGHLRAAEEVRAKIGLDKILFIPSGKPPLKTEEIADAVHRYEMTMLAIEGNPFFELSDIECRQAEKSYTVTTIGKLKKSAPAAEFFLILGIDAFLDIPNWWNPEKLVEIVHFIIISRPGFKFVNLQESPYLKLQGNILKGIDNSRSDVFMVKLESGRDAILLRLTPMGISSTEIRKLITQGKSIKYLLPPEVQSYIIIHKLYGSEKFGGYEGK